MKMADSNLCSKFIMQPDVDSQRGADAADDETFMKCESQHVMVNLHMKILGPDLLKFNVS